MVESSPYALEPDYFARYCDVHPPELRFQAKTQTEMQAWRQALQAKIRDLLCLSAYQSVPPNPRRVERVEEEAYWREKLVYETAPGITAVAYLLTPKGESHPRPSLLCPPGHGPGKEAVIQKGTIMDYGVRFAEEGYVTFVPEHLGFGERAQYYDGNSDRGYRLTNLKLQILGLPVIGLRTWDLMRGLDLMAQLPEVDPKRIGCVGLSLGGEMTLYLAALDDRIKVAIISGFLNTFRDTFFAVEHCNCGYVPGILRYAEMGDIAALIAPRPLLIESGKRDRGFPTSGALEAWAIVRRAYDVAGVADRTDFEAFDGEHAFSGRKALPWVRKWL